MLQVFNVQAAPKAHLEELGGFEHFARLIAGNEPLEVRKRSPQNFDQFVVCCSSVGIPV